MKSNSSFRFILTSAFLASAFGCAQNQNYTLAVTTQPNPLNYTGNLFSTQPSFTISPDTGQVATQGENISLVATLDPACSIAADGLFSTYALFNTASVNSGMATFVNLSYTPPIHTEEEIYLKAVGTSTGAAACTAGTSIVQHFNVGVGDTVFSQVGSAGTPVGAGSGTVDNGKTSVIDSHGLIVVAGSTQNTAPGTELVIWRYFPDGTLDTSFGAGIGFVISPSSAAGSSGTSENDSAQAVQIDGLGNIVVAGTSVNAGGGTELAVWRYTSSGTLDTSFGTSGIALFGATGVAGAINNAESDSASAMHIDASGNIVIVGTSKNTNGGTELAVWRYTSAGILDNTFAPTSAVPGSLHFGTTGTAGAMGGAELDTVGGFQFDSSKNIVIGGSSKNINAGIELAIWRYTSVGVLDATFNTSGHVVSGTMGAAGAMNGAELDKVNSFQLDSHGRFVLAGSSKNAGGGTELAIWRYTAAGVADTFGTSGHAISGTTGAGGATGANENDVANSLQIDAQGNLVVAGSSFNSAGGTYATIWRYLAAGTLDTSFNSNGIVLYGSANSTGAAGATGANQLDVANTLIVDSKDRLVLSGNSKNASGGQFLAVWRYLSTGAIDL